MAVLNGHAYKAFVSDAAEVSGNIAAIGAAVVHWYPKLFGKIAVWVSAFERLGLPGYFVYIVGVIEVFGGLMLILGLYTPVAGLLLLLDIGAAMWKYNFNEGVYAVREYELPLVVGLATLALATTGAGPFSLDHLIFRRNK
jgi:putative oxidoreductase